MAFCKHCGNKLEDGAKFCSKCGNPIGADYQVQQSFDNTAINDDEDTKSGFKKYFPYILCFVLALLLFGVWYSIREYSTPKGNTDSSISDSLAVSNNSKDSEQEIKLITEWYDYVFGKKEISDDVIDKFLSSKIKKRIWTEDYDGCYEIWQFRTIAQDYDPNVGDISKIEHISVNSDGWYEVKYLDMGSKGKTTIKIEDNIIVDFVPDSSWSDNPPTEDIEPIEEIEVVGEPTEEIECAGDAIDAAKSALNESMSNNSYEKQSQTNPTADIQPILLECQSEITTCQREIESLCRTYAALASQDIDMFKQAQMKSTFLNGVSDWVEKADRAYNRCAKKLKSAGYTNAESLIKEEKRNFHSAIYEIKSRAIQQVEMGY